MPSRIRTSVSAEIVENVNDDGLRVLFLKTLQTQGRALYSGHFFWTLHSFPFSDVFPGATAANAQFAVQLANRNTGTGWVWLLQLPCRARKLKVIEWLQESHMPILASSSGAAQPAKSAAMVSLWVVGQPLYARPKECTSLP